MNAANVFLDKVHKHACGDSCLRLKQPPVQHEEGSGVVDERAAEDLIGGSILLVTFGEAMNGTRSLATPLHLDKLLRLGRWFETR